MRVGFSTADITPPVGIWMSGYGGRERAESIHDPLELQALALEADDGARALVVGADLIGFDHDFTAAVREQASVSLGVPADAVLLNGSHTHAGPSICNHLVDEQKHRDPAYRERVFETLVSAATQAFDRLKPAEAWYAMGRCRVGINRRQGGPPYAMVPNPAGFYDDTVGVLAFLAPDTHRPRAVLFNAACHATTLGAQTVISADWCGAARRSVDAWLGGPGALFLQGAAGNIRPRTFEPGAERFRQGTFEDVDRAGHACAHEVVRLLADGLHPVGGSVVAVRRVCELPLDQAPTLDELRAMAAGSDRYEAQYADWLLAHYPDGKLPATVPYEAQLLTIGGGVSLLALPGEVVSELGFAARTTVPRPTLFCGYSNGIPAYIPTAKIRRQGGYEAGERANLYFGLPGCLTQETELVILEAVEALVAQEMMLA